MHRWAQVSTAVVAACVVAASSASAQGANINVTANVYQAIVINAGADLVFGSVFPGVPKTIAVTDGGAGRWDATGQGGVNVNMSFTLPTDLDNGGTLLPIASWTGCRDGDNTVVGCVTFTPAAGPIAAVFGGGGVLTVWIGATVTPSATQAPGAYSAIARLTLAYF